MGILGLIIAAVIVAWLAITNLKSVTHPSQPSAQLQQAAAAAGIDASDEKSLLKGVQAKIDAANKIERQRAEDIQQAAGR